MKRAAFLVLLAGAAPAFAQDHTGHEMPQTQVASGDANADQSSGSHAIGHAPMNDPQQGQTTGGQGANAQGSMPGMDHAAPPAATDEIPEGPPPPEAFEGPLHAPVAGVDPKVMAASRAQVVREVSGDTPLFWFQADRAEYRLHKGRDGYLWDVQGFYGGNLDKFWFKSEGESVFGKKLESAEVQGLWSHAIGPWFDLQAGVRQDLTGPARTHAVIGVEGLAPYRFEVAAAAFVSNKGDVTARAEAELDQRITQRLILQPRAEINLSAQDIPELGIGAGVDRIEAGLRLRYEFTRQFAPYFGVEQEWKVGNSADYARAAGERASATNFVAGLRFWF